MTTVPANRTLPLLLVAKPQYARHPSDGKLVEQDNCCRPPPGHLQAAVPPTTTLTEHLAQVLTPTTPLTTAGDQAVGSVATNGQTGAVAGSSDSPPQGLSPTASIAVAVALTAGKPSI